MSNVQNTEISDVPLYFAYRRNSSVNNSETFHSHQGIEILFIHQGKGTMVVNNRRYDIVPGMLCIFQPYQLHHLKFDYSDNVRFERSIAIFEPAVFESYFEQWPGLKAFYHYLYLSKLPSPCIYGLDNPTELMHAFQRMEQRFKSLTKQDQMEQISLFLVGLYDALQDIWKQHEGQSKPQEPRVTHQAEKILRWIEAHYAEPLRLESMSKDLHLSPYHLSHLFKASIGVSISDYLSARRIHQAAILLTATNKPITLIAEEVGITNSSYFCAFFKTHMGITPLQYRKRQSRN
ncbi:AraC family transcriptional regulator [Paenibacillus harenae]|uniref:AraC-like DNA-binding protein n=1 Tax=Paenibacillus harenae TaxID=306543 RepID=A0ABT9U3K1_PAEHA|nr:AraC family transcriptional regulator [Paenibacillus harenae]MDQ0114217.1 AraC-like DNA-binding protein [Paenibacillus harenae]